jgi:hypothetical protein
LAYFDLLRECEKPKDERKKVVTRDGDKDAPRRYHLVKGRLDALKALKKAGDKFPNPFHKGAYHYSLEALKRVAFNHVRERAEGPDEREGDHCRGGRRDGLEALQGPQSSQRGDRP